MNLFSLLPGSWKERLRRRAGAVTLRARLENLRHAGFSPRQIIDAGAYHGNWARMAADIFPGASLLLIEAQPHLIPRLNDVCCKLPAAQFRSVLLGRAPGTGHFLLEESNSRIIADPSAYPRERVLEVPVAPLATVAGATGFATCNLLKLDVQGCELEVLAGAGPLFGSVEVILLECSWLPVGGAPTAAAVIATLAAQGYQPYDVMGFNYRPLDGALWQTDFLFVRNDSPLLARRHDWA